MLSNFPNWRSGVTFPVVPISCFTGEHYCCPGHLLNARFLAKKQDPGEGTLLMLHVSMLQVLGNGFATWKSFRWLAFPGSGDVHLDSSIQCNGTRLRLGTSAVGAQSPPSPTSRESLGFHAETCTLVFSCLRWEDNLFMGSLYSFFSNLSVELYNLSDGQQGRTPL